jgi:hypothetical protein
MAVPLFDTSTPLAPLRDALHSRLAEVLDAGRYILGPEVAAFERELAGYLGVPSVWASPTARTRWCSRCARWGSAPATTWSCPRSRSTRPPRRSR